MNLINSCGPQAWQTVFHFHMHVIPRYEGDTLRLPWQPAPGDRDEIAAAARAADRVDISTPSTGRERLRECRVHV